mmetsp:Transcript_18845/g.29940  ORF Transcript_18845/g.29940 Transcript_18845/m.29940 type:complete len:153 (-) Transcript_18845:556-1014(-)
MRTNTIIVHIVTTYTSMTTTNTNCHTPVANIRVNAITRTHTTIMTNSLIIITLHSTIILVFITAVVSKHIGNIEIIFIQITATTSSILTILTQTAIGIDTKINSQHIAKVHTHTTGNTVGNSMTVGIGLTAQYERSRTLTNDANASRLNKAT